MWLIFSFLAAIFRTLKDVGFKVVLDTGPDSLNSVFCFWISMIVFLIPGAFCQFLWLRRKGKRLCVNRSLAIKAIIGSGVLNIIAYWTFMESLQRGDFSITLPMRSIVPVFAFFIGLFMLKEKVTYKTIFATVAVVLGTVMIHAYEEAGKIIFLESLMGSASQLAVLSAFIFAFAALADRYGTAAQFGGLDSVIYSALLVSASTLGFGILVLIMGSFSRVSEILSANWNSLLLVGVLGALGTIFTAKALSVGEITKVIPALRLQVLLGVLIGGTFFREEALYVRFLGACVLVIGIVMLALNPKRPEPKRI